MNSLNIINKHTWIWFYEIEDLRDSNHPRNIYLPKPICNRGPKIPNEISPYIEPMDSFIITKKIKPEVWEWAVDSLGRHLLDWKIENVSFGLNGNMYIHREILYFRKQKHALLFKMVWG